MKQLSLPFLKLGRKNLRGVRMNVCTRRNFRESALKVEKMDPAATCRDRCRGVAEE